MSKELKTLIKGPVGNIEIEAHQLKESREAAVICHPHPLFGGAMSNKVVYTLGKLFEELQIPYVKFNFRGVGKSEGQHDQGKGEQDDLKAVMDWIQQETHCEKFWLAGFSFGSFIAYQVALSLPEKISAMLLVAPPVHHYSFSNTPIHFPWLVAQGDADEVVPPDEVYQWLKTQPTPAQVLEFSGTGHFFHGKLTELKNRIQREIQKWHSENSI